MSERDRQKWNEKYQHTPTLLEVRPPSTILTRFYDRAPGKTALDLACGTGRNTLFLAHEGFDVHAVDISSVALERLSKQTSGLEVTCMEEDLDTFTPHRDKYDLLVMANFLDPDLILRCSRSMKKGALFIIETYIQHTENEKKDSNPDFLLSSGELCSFFDERFAQLAYEEFWNESYELYRMRKAAIVVQKK